MCSQHKSTARQQGRNSWPGIHGRVYNGAMSSPSKQKISIIAVLILILAMLFTTNPENVPLPLLIVPFILIFSFFYLLIQLFLKQFLKNSSKRMKQGLSISLSFMLVLLLILQSINQLTLKDQLIAFGLALLLLFYFRKIDFPA